MRHHNNGAAAIREPSANKTQTPYGSSGLRDARAFATIGAPHVKSRPDAMQITRLLRDHFRVGACRARQWCAYELVSTPAKMSVTPSASRRGSPMGRIIQPNQPLAPDRRRRFYLAVRWSGSWASSFRHSNVRHGPPAYDQARPGSWLPISMRHADEQALRWRRQTRPIFRWTVVRALA